MRKVTTVFKLVSLPGSYFESVSGSYSIHSNRPYRLLAHWRQIYFRPSKPLPKDVQFGGRPFPIHEQRPFRRAFFDFVISCICLGIPYFFVERVRLSGRSSDEESGLLRGPAPIFIIGACTSLMVCPFFHILSHFLKNPKAALVLSASVTFLSLPGLDGLTRTASMVAGLFAAFAVAATGVAVLRHKADLERPISHVGVEGIAGISVSLPFSPRMILGLIYFSTSEANHCTFSSSRLLGLLHRCVRHCPYALFFPRQIGRKPISEESF